MLKSCAPFTNSESEINNIEVDNTQDINIKMSMYNLIEYNDAYLKTPRSLWQYTIEMNQLEILLIFLIVTIIVFYSKLNSK